ncbi:hypothetical protein [Hymenobacter sp. B81]|uniref:hypothetical protein n=1 Tax=Hymenobacter sp. B81 TaxID=3344878 RepID=UPI0037DD52E5
MMNPTWKACCLLALLFAMSIALHAQSAVVEKSAVPAGIVYQFPEAVTRKVNDYLDKVSGERDTVRYACKLYIRADGKYHIGIWDFYSGKRKDDLLYNRIISKSNRHVDLGNNRLLPVFFDHDLAFADLGSVRTADGRIGQIKLISSFDGFTVTFDHKGTIY